MLFTKRALVLVFLTVIFLTTFSPVLADGYTEPLAKNPMLEIGFKKDHPYNFGDICSVDLANGTLIVRIPVATLKGKNGKEYTQNLQYNSNVVLDVYHDEGSGGGETYINMTWDDTSWSSHVNPAWTLELPYVTYTGYFDERPEFAGITSYNELQVQGMGSTSFHVLGREYIGLDDSASWTGDSLYFGDNAIAIESPRSIWPYREVKLLDTLTQTYFTLGTVEGFQNGGLDCFQGWEESSVPNYLNSQLSTPQIPSTPTAPTSPTIRTFENKITYPTGDMLGFTFSRSDDASFSEPSLLDKIWFRFRRLDPRIPNPMGLTEPFDRSITCNYSTTGHPYLTSLNWTSGEGATSTNFEYEVAETRTYGDDSYHYKRLKKVILPDGSNYEFEYYSLDGKVTPSGPDMRANGNAYLDLGTVDGKIRVWDPSEHGYKIVDQTRTVASGFPLLKCIYLPTGGRIDIEYQIQGFVWKYELGRTEGFDEEWNRSDEEWVSIVLGVKSLKYYSSRTSQTAVLTKEFKLLKVYDFSGASGEAHFNDDLTPISLNDFEVVDYSSEGGDELRAMVLNNMGSNLFKLNPSGRRVVEAGDNGKILSMGDTIFSSGMTASDEYVKKKYRKVVKTINYLVPKPATPDTSNPDFNKGRIETEYSYLTRRILYNAAQDLSFLPVMERITYTDSWFPSNVEKVIHGLDENGQDSIVRKDKTLTSYYGITDKTQPVLQSSQSSTVTDGADTELYSIQRNNTYYFKLSYVDDPDDATDACEAWGKDKIAKIKQILWHVSDVEDSNGKYWMKKFDYDSSNGLPWQTSSIQWGPTSSDGMNFSGDYHLQADLEYYSHFNYQTAYDRLGFNKGYFLESRTVSMRNQAGALYKPAGMDENYPFVNEITEAFDYEGGSLKTYTLGGILSTSQDVSSITGLVLSRTNPDGTSASYAWDSSNRLIGIHPKGWDGSDLTATSIDYTNYNSGTNTMAHVAVTGPKSAEYYYDGLGRLTYEGVGAYNGKFDWSRVHYDSLERADKNWTGLRLASGTTPTSSVTNIEGKGWGDVARTEHSYDGYGRETDTKVYASGSTLESEIALAYSGFTKTETLHDKTGVINRVRKFISDAKGSLKQLWIGKGTNPLVKKMEYTYSTLFNKLKKVQINDKDAASFQTRSFSYDDIGNLTSTRTPEEELITYSGYNLFGKPATKTHVDKIIGFTYDTLGRETKRQQQNATGTPISGTVISTTWGGLRRYKGKITQVDSGTTADGSTTNFEYESPAAQLTSRKNTIRVSGETVEETVERTVGYHYKTETTPQTIATTLLDKITFPEETISGLTGTRNLSITYGTNQYPTDLTLVFKPADHDYGQALVSNMAYKVTGGIKYKTGDGLQTQYTNDTLGRLTELSHGNVLDFSNYAYDVRGNITSVNMSEPDAAAGTTRHLSYSYDYDIYNRLTGANYLQDINGYNQAAWNETFDYDPVGNMTAKNFNPPASSTLTFGSVHSFGTTYDSKNQDQDSSVQYDAYGNVTQLTVEGKGNTLDLTYSPFNQVTSVTEGANRYEYTYDGEGKRIVKKVYKNTSELSEIHIYIRGATGKILEELKKVKQENGTWPNDWTWVKDYYYFGDKLISAASAE